MLASKVRVRLSRRQPSLSSLVDHDEVVEVHSFGKNENLHVVGDPVGVSVTVNGAPVYTLRGAHRKRLNSERGVRVPSPACVSWQLCAAEAATAGSRVVHGSCFRRVKTDSAEEQPARLDRT